MIHTFSWSTLIAYCSHLAPLPSSLGPSTFAGSWCSWLILVSCTKWEFGYYRTCLLLHTGFNKEGLLLCCHLSLMSCSPCFSPSHLADCYCRSLLVPSSLPSHPEDLPFQPSARIYGIFSCQIHPHLLCGNC